MIDCNKKEQIISEKITEKQIELLTRRVFSELKEDYVIIEKEKYLNDLKNLRKLITDHLEKTKIPDEISLILNQENRNNE